MEAIKELRIIVGNAAAVPLVIQQGAAGLGGDGVQFGQDLILHGLGNAERIAHLGAHILGHGRQYDGQGDAFVLAAGGQLGQAGQLGFVQRPAAALGGDDGRVIVQFAVQRQGSAVVRR